MAGNLFLWISIQPNLQIVAKPDNDLVNVLQNNKISDFFIRTQTQSQKHRELDGTWYRGFDYTKWDYWGSDGDAGWGVWSNEIGWTHSWITATLALREMRTNFWELSSGSKVAEKFDYYRKMMLPDNVLKKKSKVL